MAGLATHLPDLEAAAGLSVAEGVDRRLASVAGVLHAAATDGIFTIAEDEHALAMSEALDVDINSAILRQPGLLGELQVASVNAGRLTPVPSPSIILKKGETDWLEVPAALLKEVVDREMRGGYSGVSFRVAKGVRVHTGGMRAHSVVTGTHIEIADQGTLVVTSTRIVFRGMRQGLEVPYSRLLSVNGYNDGVGLVVSNRAKVPVFQLANGPLVVATINAAAGA